MSSCEGNQQAQGTDSSRYVKQKKYRHSANRDYANKFNSQRLNHGSIGPADPSARSENEGQRSPDELRVAEWEHLSEFAFFRGRDVEEAVVDDTAGALDDDSACAYLFGTCVIAVIAIVYFFLGLWALYESLF